METTLYKHLANNRYGIQLQVKLLNQDAYISMDSHNIILKPSRVLL